MRCLSLFCMRMTRKSFWLIAAVAAAMISCEKSLPKVNEPDEEESQEQEEPGLPAIDDTSAPTLIAAEIPSSVGTKVSITASDTPGLALAWEAEIGRAHV